MYENNANWTNPKDNNPLEVIETSNFAFKKVKTIFLIFSLYLNILI